MKNSLHISIPQPCHEDWDKMTPTEQGRFCDACNKCVVDFTRFTDDELLAYFSNPPKNLCGRFENRQLNKTIEKAPIYKPWFSFPKKWIVAAGLWAGMLAKGVANTPSVNALTSQQITFSLAFEPETTNDSIRTIRGVVIDSTANEPLIGVTVLISGTKIGTASDLEGKFKLLLPKEYFNKEAIIEVRYSGYETIFHSFSTKENMSIIYLKEKEYDEEKYETIHVIMGRIGHDSINEIAEQKEEPTRWQRIKTFFRNLF